MKRVVYVLVCFLACLGALTQAALAASLVYNSGPSRRGSLHFDYSQGGACTVASISNLDDEGQLDGNPSSSCSSGFYCNGVNKVAPDGSCPTYFFINYGWTKNEFAQYPGWNVWDVPWGGGTMTLKNDARNAAGPCELREVAFELLHWPPNIGKWSFKDDYMLGDIAALRGIFSARRKSESTSSSCTSEPRRFLKADGVVRYMSGTIALRTDYISIVLYNPTNLDFDLNPNNEILWTNGCTQNSSTCSVNLHGNKLGHPTLTGSWQTWNINFKSYFSQYFPSPPGGQSVDDAHVVAFEVYTSVRGSDLDVELKDLDVQD